MAARVDALFYFLVAVSVFFAALIFLLIVVFAVKYRRRAEDERPQPIEGKLWLEILWSVIPLGLTMVMFVWGAIIYFDIYNPPRRRSGDQCRRQAVDVESPACRRAKAKINELHVPVGQPVKLTMTSEDVIHDVFLPAFRIKQDVLPGRYTSAVVRGDEGGGLSIILRRILRHPAFGDDWAGGGAGAGRV